MEENRALIGTLNTHRAVERFRADGGMVEGAPEDNGVHARMRPVEASKLHRRWHEARVVLSLSVFPGCPHLYVGQLVRGVLWSSLFLFVLLPMSFFLFFMWAFSERALFLVLIGLGTCLILGALGPAVHAFRSSSLRPRGRRSVGVAVYASVIALAFAAESGWFLFKHLETVRVSSEFLEPLVGQGEDAAILLSRYARPVHGEVVLIAPSPDRVVRADSQRRLGRVIATPGDDVSLQKGNVFVNGIRIDFARSDQRRRLEKAGRRIRRERLVTSLFSGEADLTAIRDRRVSLQGEDWKFVLPAGSYLVAPDVRPSVEPSVEEPGGTTFGEKSRSPSRVPVAWLVDRSDVVGRMIARFW